MLSALRSPRYSGWLVLAVLSAGLMLALTAKPASAQPPSCNDVIDQLDGALAPGICQAIGLGNACLATRSVNATARTGTLRFTTPGDEARLNNIRRMITVPQKGAAVLLGGTAANPVKVLVFGDTATSPSSTQSGRVFTLRAANGQPTCERTRSGMILQTPNGKNGTIVVNGVTINLGSTAYVVPGADLLFDQDPRINRRQGSRNRSAPLCSGFDSDCGFGDDSCRENERMVYGPFCREDTYPYINAGLYRVTLYGEGEVQAGATDYNISHDYELYGTQHFHLPGSYTFCYGGLEDGGTGFETMVQARSSGAFVDHITLEYLGEDCGLPAADDPSAGMGSDEMGMVTIYNMEGDVGVELPNGEGNSPDEGQRLRIYYEGGEPVAMDRFPTDAPYIMGSDLAQWATGASGSGLPDVRVVDAGTETPTTRDPQVSVEASVLYDGEFPYAVRIEAYANDPSAGSGNGDGIDSVYFSIRDEFGSVVYENTEDNPAYCAFGGDSPCEESLSSELLGSGSYRVTATAYSDSGRQASASAEFEVGYAVTEDPVVWVDAQVLYDGSVPYALRIEASAYDPGVGDGNGDGIDSVYFQIRNSDGGLVWENEEGSPAYCAFGGDSPCVQSISQDDVESDDYEVTATAYAGSGAQASASTSFSLDWGSVVEAADTTPPFFNSISYPSGDFCYGDKITVGADAYDKSEITNVTLYYQVLWVDPEFPEYGSYPYESVNVGSGDGPYEGSFSVGDLNTANFYFTAVDEAGNVATSDTITLKGRSCDVIVD